MSMKQQPSPLQIMTNTHSPIVDKLESVEGPLLANVSGATNAHAPRGTLQASMGGVYIADGKGGWERYR